MYIGKVIYVFEGRVLRFAGLGQTLAEINMKTLADVVKGQRSWSCGSEADVLALIMFDRGNVRARPRVTPAKGRSASPMSVCAEFEWSLVLYVAKRTRPSCEESALLSLQLTFFWSSKSATVLIILTTRTEKQNR